MLEKLSHEQEKLIPIVRDEWIKFCLGGNTEINREMASKGLRWIYGLANLDEPRIIFVSGPFACQMAVWFIEELGENKTIPKEARESVWASVGASVRESVWDSVRASVRESVRESVGASVRESVGDSVRESVGASVGESGKTFQEFGWCDLGGNAGWTAWADYFDRIGIKLHENFYPFRDLLRSGVFMSIYLKGFAIVCPRPSVIHKNSTGQLNKDLSPAIQWEGEDYFFLNGVRMKKKHVMLPAEKIDINEIVSEKNTEVRRELIRKIGIDRFIQKSGAKVLDKKGDYELLSVWLSDEVPDARYLKMKNPSIGVWHVEGVEGNTVQEAINWRAGNIKEKWEPGVLT